ncbi:hypothetical protein [Marinoscillum furvescens]|uniref:TonB-like protein n=1 Tax=Marinoscillum furvescens DSM 4134 TaxID=1122208 RepID=A0A3D9L1H1_MARFU|nr:hypothetical protein [Marinoscillum furvescens]RED95993.1 hypothetical protein C7460_11651 [Marinoscillum furvescens DSM 4134]
MKTCHLLYLLLWCPLLVFSQPKQELESIYKGSFADFYKSVSSQIMMYPNDESGVLVLVWVVKNGVIEDIYLPNPLSKTQNSSVIAAISSTRDKWSASQTKKAFILPVIFSKVKRTEMSFPDHFLPPLHIISFSKTTVKNLNTGATASSIKHAQEPSEASLAGKAQKLITKGKYKKALTPLNVLIKRFPLTEEYRNMRLACYQATNKIDEICTEAVFMKLIFQMEPIHECVK